MNKIFTDIAYLQNPNKTADILEAEPNVRLNDYTKNMSQPLFCPGDTYSTTTKAYSKTNTDLSRQSRPKSAANYAAKNGNISAHILKMR